MACTSPLYRLDCTLFNAEARLPPRFYRRIRYDAIIMNYADYKYLVNVHKLHEDFFVTIPCGQCIDCRLEKSRQWAIRCMQEAQYYKDNYFFTLTYSPEALPVADFTDTFTGDIFSMPTLVKNDMQKFNKDLRRFYDYHYGFDGIRFFGSGEYSPVKQRPHYHYLFFNLPIYDLKYYGLSKSGQPLWFSPTMDKIWNKGLVFIGKVSYESCAYTAKYCLKKVTGKKKAQRDEVLKRLTDESGQILSEFASKVDEFTLMSRKPGIGRQFYDDNKMKIYKNDEMFIAQDGMALKVRPVSYYDRLFDQDEPELFEEIKQRRKFLAEQSNLFALKNSHLTDVEYNELRARLTFRKLKKNQPVDVF